MNDLSPTQTFAQLLAAQPDTPRPIDDVLFLMLPLLRMVERTLGFGLLQINAWLSAMVFPVPHALQEQPVQGIPYGLAIACGGAFALWGHT